MQPIRAHLGQIGLAFTTTATIHRILDAVLRTTTGRNGCGGRRCRPPYAKPREVAAAVPPGLCPATPMVAAAGREMPWDGLRRRGARGSPGRRSAAARERGGFGREAEVPHVSRCPSRQLIGCFKNLIFAPPSFKVLLYPLTYNKPILV
jgi:hypothetical protein